MVVLSSFHCCCFLFLCGGGGGGGGGSIVVTVIDIDSDHGHYQRPEMLRPELLVVQHGRGRQISQVMLFDFVINYNTQNTIRKESQTSVCLDF